jgi:phospholipid/cholesterol/gamma-HCH transport system substrate-binding protein
MVMNTRDHSYAVVGVLVLASAVLFTALFSYSTNRALGTRRAQLWIELPAADGLKKGDQLLFRGVQVGEVRSLQFGTEGVLVRTVLTRPVPLTKGAHARLVAADLFGRQTLVLDAGPGKRPLVGGDTLRGAAPLSMNGRIDGVAARIERMVGDTTVDAVRVLLADAAAAALALENALHATQYAVSLQAEPLHRTLAATAGLAENLRAVADTTRLAAAVDRTTLLLERLDVAAARIDTASALMVSTLARVESGRGSIGRLTADEALYDRAVATMAEVEALLGDVRRNPKRYFTVKIF